MNCPYCDNEIVTEDAIFCPKCGKSLAPEEEMHQESIEVQQKQPEFVLVAAMLTIIAAAFSAGLGYTAVYQYISYVSYYDISILLGFLILGILCIVVSAFALAGGVFMLKRKYIKISMLGVILLLVSVVVNYIIRQHYQYGFTEIVLLSEISIVIFSIISGIFVATSKDEFA